MRHLIKNIISNYCLLLYVLLISISGVAHAQKMTRIKGTVTDAANNEPLPFVNIFFKGKSIGTITDYNGYYTIETQWPSNKIIASFIGYDSDSMSVEIGKNQVINFKLSQNSIELGTAIVIGESKTRYRNKNNPAVELIRKVIDNKNENRKEGLNFYEYEKYEKVEFDLNNITEDFKNKRIFKKFQFLFDYIDTSSINGKPFLPVFLKETSSKIYYRNSPKTLKEYISGVNMVGFEDYLDDEGVSYFVDNLYQEIDLYNNNIDLLTNQFVSPLSDIAPSIYKFHILDTLNINGKSCIQLAFQPRNKADFAFKGNLFILNNESYALVKAELRIVEQINLNFVNDLVINQEFDLIDNNTWMLTKDEIIIDFNLGTKGVGMYGKKSNSYRNYIVGYEQSPGIYSGITNIVTEEDYKDRNTAFWDTTRHSALTQSEKDIFTMVDSVQKVPAFKRTMDVLVLLLAGYWSFDKIDVGPVNAFYSFNDIEGFRLRLGGRTNNKFSETLMLEGYGLYGFDDEIFKYSCAGTYSLNGKPLKENPRHSIKAMYQYETNFPGMEMQFINEDNFLLSLKRGVSDKILYYKLFELEHIKDWGSGISSTLRFKNLIQEPGGNLYFNYDDYSVNSITTTEVIAQLRIAPNEKFYQGISNRRTIITKFPILNIVYTQGFNDVLSSEYSYEKLTLNLFKRVYTSPLGYNDIELECGKIFGEVPYPLLTIHRANQTYSYQLRSYNLMNFLEFVSDQYISLNSEHHFNGFIFNKLPLIKHLKLREVLSFKGIIGGITDKNNPSKSENLMQFPVDEQGGTTTFSLKKEPYIEISAGIANIFKLFRIDVVKRLTYLDNPNVTDIGIRARFKFEF